MHYRLCLLAVGIPERVLLGTRVEPRPSPGAWRHDIAAFEDDEVSERLEREIQRSCRSGAPVSRTRGAP
jgi:hypothetical protein